MLNIHPHYLEKDGRAEFVVLSIEKFQSLRDPLEDMEDRLDLRNAKAKEGGPDTVPLICGPTLRDGRRRKDSAIVY